MAILKKLNYQHTMLCNYMSYWITINAEQKNLQLFATELRNMLLNKKQYAHVYLNLIRINETTNKCVVETLNMKPNVISVIFEYLNDACSIECSMINNQTYIDMYLSSISVWINCEETIFRFKLTLFTVDFYVLLTLIESNFVDVVIMSSHDLVINRINDYLKFMNYFMLVNFGKNDFIMNIDSDSTFTIFKDTYQNHVVRNDSVIHIQRSISNNEHFVTIIIIMRMLVRLINECYNHINVR